MAGEGKVTTAERNRERNEDISSLANGKLIFSMKPTPLRFRVIWFPRRRNRVEMEKYELARGI